MKHEEGGIVSGSVSLPEPTFDPKLFTAFRGIERTVTLGIRDLRRQVRKFALVICDEPPIAELTDEYRLRLARNRATAYPAIGMQLDEEFSRGAYHDRLITMHGYLKQQIWKLPYPQVLNEYMR